MSREHYARDSLEPAARFDDHETTISHLVRFPHPALGGRTYGQALADALMARGLAAPGVPVVEVGGGLGSVGADVSRRVGAPWIALDLSPRLLAAQRARARVAAARWAGVRADAVSLPLRAGAVRGLLFANEVLAGLPVALGPNGLLVAAGARALVREAVRVLAPGAALCLIEFGGGGPPEPVALGRGAGAHTEHTVCFPDLLAEARAAGLEAEVVRLVDLLGFDLAMRVTSCDDVRRLRSLAPDLPMAAWSPEELSRHHGWLGRVFALELPAIGSLRFPDLRAKGGLAQLFFALLGKKPSPKTPRASAASAAATSR